MTLGDLRLRILATTYLEQGDSLTWYSFRGHAPDERVGSAPCSRVRFVDMKQLKGDKDLPPVMTAPRPNRGVPPEAVPCQRTEGFGHGHVFATLSSRFQQPRLFKTGGRLIRHARYLLKG